MVRVTDESCHNNVQAGFIEGEREQLGTRPKFLNQRHYIIQHMLREVRHAGGVRRPPLVDLLFGSSLFRVIVRIYPTKLLLYC